MSLKVSRGWKRPRTSNATYLAAHQYPDGRSYGLVDELQRKNSIRHCDAFPQLVQIYCNAWRIQSSVPIFLIPAFSLSLGSYVLGWLGSYMSYGGRPTSTCLCSAFSPSSVAGRWRLRTRVSRVQYLIVSLFTSRRWKCRKDSAWARGQW